jgi:hypothetical protein
VGINVIVGTALGRLPDSNRPAPRRAISAVAAADAVFAEARSAARVELAAHASIRGRPPKRGHVRPSGCPVGRGISPVGRLFLLRRLVCRSGRETRRRVRGVRGQSQHHRCHAGLSAGEFSGRECATGAVYAKALAALPADQRVKLREAQRRWLAFRSSDCDVFFGTQTGTVAGVQNVGCMIDRTEKRIENLQDLLPL